MYCGQQSLIELSLDPPVVGSTDDERMRFEAQTWPRIWMAFSRSPRLTGTSLWRSNRKNPQIS